MINRDAFGILKYLGSKFPAVAIMGPRQSGKTTLSRLVFPNHAYINFEDFDLRELASNDPHRFLSMYQNGQGIILDEIQHVPKLLSYVQIYSDENERPGFYIVTGSQNYLVNERITQSLAGRMAIVTLLPLSINELKNANLLPSLDEVILNGGYPRLYNQSLSPDNMYPAYINQYIERDVRQITKVHNLELFQKFLQLCAGRIGQLLNLNSLASDTGINASTAREWLSLLQATYIVYTLQPYFKNFSKRLVKTPKLYFYDTGLACSLLRIKTTEQLAWHYAYGHLFENFVITEIMKSYYNKGTRPSIYFWRDSQGHELDVLIEEGSNLIPIEIKSSQTISSDYFDGLNYWNELAAANPENGYIIYAGKHVQQRSQGNVVNWQSIPDFSLPKITK